MDFMTNDVLLRNLLFPLKRTISLTFASIIIIAVVRQSGYAAVTIVVMGIPAILLILPARTIAKQISTFSRLYILISLTHLASIVAVSATILPGRGAEHFSGSAEIPFFAWFLIVIIQLVFLLVAVPTKILPFWRENVKQTVDVIEIDTTSVRNHLESISVGFDEFQRIVDKEKVNLDGILIQTRKSLEKQLQELEATRDNLEKQRQETEYLKALAELSKDQQAVFLETMQRNKNTDYWVGFGLGILASLFSSGLIIAAEKMLK